MLARVSVNIGYRMHITKIVRLHAIATAAAKTMTVRIIRMVRWALADMSD
jgi:hypothetical protein